jgi:DNA modification methylase
MKVKFRLQEMKMQTRHKIIFKNSNHMHAVSDSSVDLIVTSPPYPMIQMWDALFARLDPGIKNALDHENGMPAFELMHRQLVPVWREMFRILKPGGIACVNIGDATRTVGDSFMLYPNAAVILSNMLDLGFSCLPRILWRKQTNAPNKFMGSGMLPPYAYVTLEHEHIIIFRKGLRRGFTRTDEKKIRRESAYFWEERNVWFSDIWMDLKGTTQKLKDEKVRGRSAAFPFELPFRLINMFSVKGDTVVDPFLGTGTTMMAAMAAGRNSIGFELEADFQNALLDAMAVIVEISNTRIDDRLAAHLAFVKERTDSGYDFKYTSRHYGFPVMTRQEIELMFNPLLQITVTGDNEYRVDYSNDPQHVYRHDELPRVKTESRSNRSHSAKRNLPAKGPVQRNLFSG